MIITASAASSWTVVRGQCGTSAAAHDNASTIYLIGHTSYDNTDITTDKQKTATIITNYVQPILLPLEQTLIAQAVASVKGASIFEKAKRLLLAEAMRSLELSVINGTVQSGAASGTVMGTMNGLLALITTNTTAASSAEITESYIIASQQQMWTYGGVSNLGLTGAFNKKVMGGWTQDRVRFTQSERRLGGIVGEYESDFGVIELLLDRYVLPGDFILINTDAVRLRPLIPFTYFEVARTGTADKGFIYGVYSVELNGQKKNGAKITGLATS
jgi:hypothetical protein